MNLRRASVLAAMCLVMGATMVLTASSRAQIPLTPRVFRVDTFTCAELLSLPSESNDRFLIYYNGYVSGMRQLTTWDERVEGALVERAVGYCRADPTATVLSAFRRAQPR